VEVGRVAEKRNLYKTWLEYLKEIVHLEDLSVDGRIVLRWIIRK
jgi:hypothetical protein